MVPPEAFIFSGIFILLIISFLITCSCCNFGTGRIAYCADPWWWCYLNNMFDICSSTHHAVPTTAATDVETGNAEHHGGCFGCCADDDGCCGDQDGCCSNDNGEWGCCEGGGNNSGGCCEGGDDSGGGCCDGECDGGGDNGGGSGGCDGGGDGDCGDCNC